MKSVQSFVCSLLISFISAAMSETFAIGARPILHREFSKTRKKKARWSGIPRSI